MALQSGKAENRMPMRNHHCKTTLRNDIDATGEISPAGHGCANCYGCESFLGDGGVVGESGFRIVAESWGVSVSWACPICGTMVSEKTTVLHAERTAREVGNDLACYYCRKRTNAKMVMKC